MSKIRVITKEEYIVEWDDGRKIDLSCGDVVKVYFVDGTYLEGIVLFFTLYELLICRIRQNKCISILPCHEG